MTKKKKKLVEGVNEPSAIYKPNSITIFKSFEEQENYNRSQMAYLSPYERLLQLRKMINMAYAMHGFDPRNLPSKHKLTFVSK